MKRRSFFKDIARGVLLGGVALGVAYLASRKNSSKKRVGVCMTKNGQCHNCPALQTCRHPNALSFLVNRHKLGEHVE